MKLFFEILGGIALTIIIIAGIIFNRLNYDSENGINPFE